MVVDVDETSALEAQEPGARDAVTFEKDSGRGEVGFDLAGIGDEVDAVDSGKCTEDLRSFVGEDDEYLGAELIEDLGEGEDGADGVPVGSCASPAP